jgi:hypothetical protein
MRRLGVVAGSIPPVVVVLRIGLARSRYTLTVVSEHTCTTFLIWECGMGEGE